MRRSLAVLILASMGCARCAPSPAGEPAAPAVDLRFEIAGCAAVTRGPVCEVTEAQRTVRVRVVPDDASVRVTWGEAVLTPAVTKQDGGQLLAIEVPRGAEDGVLAVEAAKAPLHGAAASAARNTPAQRRGRTVTAHRMKGCCS